MTEINIVELRRMAGDWSLCSGTIRNALEMVLDAYEELSIEHEKALLEIDQRDERST